MVDPVVAEYGRRRDGERVKAFQKYGAIALSSVGDPSRDVLDYAVNELIGLVRYAQMIEARADEALAAEETAPEVRNAFHEARAVARQVEASAGRHACDLISARQRLLRLKVPLGAAEQR